MKKIKSSREYAEYQEKRTKENVDLPDSWTINIKEIDCDLFKEDKNKCPDITYLKKELKRSEMDDILAAFKKCKTTTLSPVYNLMIKEKKKTTYLKIRIARLFLE